MAYVHAKIGKIIQKNAFKEDFRAIICFYTGIPNMYRALRERGALLQNTLLSENIST